MKRVLCNLAIGRVTAACIVALAAINAVASAEANQGDLAIGMDDKTGRPNAFIAWRNTARILEVEVEVKNLGERQARGRVYLAVLDDHGRVLSSNTGRKDLPQIVKLPPASKGGSDGQIVQVLGTRALNLLIDELDRANTPYSIKAWIVPNGKDAARANNAVVKSFNVPSRVKPGAAHFQEYSFANTLGRDLEIVWNLESSKIPPGWHIGGGFDNGAKTKVSAGSVTNGYLKVITPADLEHGSQVDLTVFGRDAKTNEVVFQYEWYAVYDTKAPDITALEHSVLDASGEIRFTATVDDGTSMLKEASGVRIEYTTDGVTYSSRTMAYDAGNFVGPTSFDTRIGPFTPGTEVSGQVVASDIAGNAVRAPFGPLRIAEPGELARNGIPQHHAR